MRFSTIQRIGFSRGAGWCLLALVGLLLTSCATRPQPESAQEHLQRAAQLLDKPDRVAEREKELRAAIECDPASVVGHNDLGVLLMKQRGRAKEAVSELKTATRLGGGAASWANLSAALIAAKSYREAIAAADMAIELDANLAYAYYSRASAHHHFHELKAALADFLRAAQLDPGWSDKEYWVGYTYYELNDYEQAVRHLSSSIAMNPRASRAYRMRGSSLIMLKRLPEALVDYNRALELNPADDDYWNVRGMLYAKMERFPEALADLSHAIELKPDEDTYWSDRGEVYLQLKRKQEARRDFDEAIRLNPKSDSARYWRAELFEEAGDIQSAVQDKEVTASNSPASPEARRELGVLKYRLGDFRGALGEFRKAASLASESSYEQFMIYLLDRRVRGVKDARELVQVSAKTDDAWTKAIASFLAGASTEEALIATVETGGEAGKRAERTCEAFYYAGMVRLLDGDALRARAYFEKCVAANVQNFIEHKMALRELATLAAREGEKR